MMRNGCGGHMVYGHLTGAGYVSDCMCLVCNMEVKVD